MRPGRIYIVGYLRKLCYEGLEKRYAERADELRERLDYELGTIKNMGM